MHCFQGISSFLFPFTFCASGHRWGQKTMREKRVSSSSFLLSPKWSISLHHHMLLSLLPPLFHLRSLILPPSKPVFVRSRRSLWATVCSNCCHSEREKGEKTKGSCRKRKSCTCTRFAQEVFSLNSPPLPFFQLLWKKRNFNSSLFPQRRQFEVE